MKGLFQKYLIHKADGSAVDPDADYFVLRLDKDLHARQAATAYAFSVRQENPALAKDILDKVESYKDMISVKTYSVWVEGYMATGESGKAFVYATSTGRTFKEACDNLAENNPTFSGYYNPGRLTYWGCRLYDNEMQARASFG